MNKNCKHLMKNSYFVFLIVILLLSCSEPIARKPVVRKTTTVTSEAIKENKKLIALENSFIEKYIALDSIHKYQVSTHGFWYYYNLKKENETITPKIGDVVEFSYTIQQLNGVDIYSKEELGIKEYAVDKEDFIPGLQEGIKLMKVGEIITFVIPSYRAFGLVGDGNRIKINQTIKSTITLLNIKQK